MAKFLLWIVRAALGLIAFFASVGPEGAKSNISEWLTLAGLDELPPHIRNHNVDQPIAFAAIILIFVSMIPWRRFWTQILAQFHQSARHSDPETLEWFWEMEGFPVYWLGMMRSGFDPVRVTGFQLQGRNHGALIDNMSGFVRSDMTGQSLPIFLNVEGDPVLPEETYGIPAGADFGVCAFFGERNSTRPGINSEQFIGEFGAFTVVIEYDGKRWQRSFGEEEIEAQMSRFVRESRRGTAQPRVTRKATG
ncbi:MULTISPECIES: hypothetical protein [unclassified Sphingopyxis]|uniref:hypothetical protein n=1 Tax=unclassified Sphingopyxis TaxID=2614943 RepID=UPI00285888CE|nr:MULTISPECIES: hypothetical protein [unclassified Sphingopyxis]MDR6834843.1 hypothetical protein [Sphingopyxis sp. BE122]MDR7227114.1 hypothetical protein [Sphingopyxis sp. BE259]